MLIQNLSSVFIVLCEIWRAAAKPDSVQLIFLLVNFKKRKEKESHCMCLQPRIVFSCLQWYEKIHRESFGFILVLYTSLKFWYHDNCSLPLSLYETSFPTRSLIITCVWQVKSILSVSVSWCVSVHLSVFAYPGIYSATDIRPQWWRVSSSGSLAQTPALMRLPSAGWTLSHSSPLCAAPYRPRTSLPIVSCSQIKRELISQLAQLLVPPCQCSQFSSVPHPSSPVCLLWDGA